MPVPALALAVLFLLPPQLQAQTATRAVRDDGSVVWLLANGTWRPDSSAPKPRPAAGSSHTKSANATLRMPFLKKGSLSIDPNKWRQTQSEPGKVVFTHVNGDGYGMVVSERTEVTTDALVQIALTNARSVAPDMRILLQEERVVNGVPVKMLQMGGSMQGINFIFYGYYYAGAEGTIQVITYTSNNLFEEYRPDFDEFLNGFELAP